MAVLSCYSVPVMKTPLDKIFLQTCRKTECSLKIHERKLLVDMNHEVHSVRIVICIVQLERLKTRMKTFTMGEELKTFLFVFEVFGMHFFSSKSLAHSNSKDRFKVFRVLYMVILSTSSSFVLIDIVLDENMMNIKNLSAKTVLMLAIQHSMKIGLVMVFCMSLFQSFTSTQSLKQIFFNSHEIKRLCLNEFGISVDYKLLKRKAWIRMIAMLTFLLTLHVIVIILRHSSTLGFFKSLAGTFMILILLMIVYKFVFYVEIVNHQLGLLQVILNETFTCASARTTGNVVNLTASKPVGNLLGKIQTARKIYNTIHENGDLINKSHGPIMLILLADLVIVLTASGYEVFVIIIGGLPTYKVIGEMLMQSPLENT